METLKLQLEQMKQINKALSLVKPVNESQKRKIQIEYQKNVDFILEVTFKISALESFRSFKKAV